MKEHEKMCKGTVEQGIDFPPNIQVIKVLGGKKALFINFISFESS